MTPEQYLELPYTYCLVWNQESKTWTGTIKELPGCIAQGYTAEILDNLWYAALDWISAALDLGQKIPRPEGK
jgi:predicted RNase H-like HicB family nuclease